MRAPTRVDFGGGWTDVPPYAECEGGVVCAMAIARYAVARIGSGSADFGRRYPDPAPQMEREPPPTASPWGAESPLVVAALKRAGMTPDELALSLSSDFPVGAGLGGSSAASAAILGALDRWRGVPVDRVAIAECGRRIEVEDLGVPGGRQDHYCATHGGLLALTFGSVVRVGRISLLPALRQALERRCILVYSGRSRVSGETITGVLDGYRRGERRITFALARMRTLASQMIGALTRGNVDDLGALVGEHWAHQRALDPAIPTPAIDDIIARALHAGALGAKATGASGGGCVVAIAAEGREEDVRHAVAAGGALVPFTIDDTGLSECDWNAATR